MGRQKSDYRALERTGGEKLTHAGLVRMELIASSPAVAPFVTTFFRIQSDEVQIRDVQPSSLGVFAIMATGSGVIRFIDGHSDPGQRLSVITPTAAATTFEVSGPWDMFGAMLSPVGWAALTGLSAAHHGNRLRPAGDVVPQPLVDAGEAIVQEYGRLSNVEMADRLGRAILGAVRPLPERHVALIRKVAEWLARSLSPRLDDLLAETDYSLRQLQRLCERYFGLPPRSLARKYRAVRAAVLLSRPGITADEITSIEDHFYDQSHMIREIRLFAGRTPARIADPDTPYLSAFLELRDFRDDAGPRMAPIPPDLRA